MPITYQRTIEATPVTIDGREFMLLDREAFEAIFGADPQTVLAVHDPATGNRVTALKQNHRAAKPRRVKPHARKKLAAPAEATPAAAAKPAKRWPPPPQPKTNSGPTIADTIRGALAAGCDDLSTITDFVQKRISVDERQVSNNLYQLYRTGQAIKEDGHYRPATQGGN